MSEWATTGESTTSDSPSELAGGTAALWEYRGVYLLLLDAFTIFSTFLVSYYLRFHVQFLAVKHVSPREIDGYLQGGVVLTAIWVFFIWRTGEYRSGSRTDRLTRIRGLLSAGIKALAVQMAVSYLYRDFLLSRQVYLMTGVIAPSVMVAVRLLFAALDRELADRGVVLKRILVAGLDDQSARFAQRLAQDCGGERVIGFLAADAKEPRFADLPVLGDLDSFAEVHRRQPFDKLVLSHSVPAQAQDREARERLISLLNFCESRGVDLFILPNALDVAVNADEIGSFAGVPMVQLRDASLHAFYAVVKRVLDLVVAAAVLLLGLPFWVAIAVAIKLTSKGPVFFSQYRVGKHGKQFRMYKFRSMVVDAEDRLKDLVDFDKLAVPGFKIKGDPRVTPIGRFLRSSSLDELPQLLNVIKGEMSLVGPRPELPALVDRYDAWQWRRVKAKPGITGYQQIMARGRPLAEVADYDLVYLKQQSLLFDLYIMLMTIPAVLLHRGVTH